MLYIQCNSTEPITNAISYFALNDITFCIYSGKGVKECFCLFSLYPQLTNKDEVSKANERSSCLTGFESVVVTYCEIKHHFAMHSISLWKMMW